MSGCNFKAEAGLFPLKIRVRMLVRNWKLSVSIKIRCLDVILDLGLICFCKKSTAGLIAEPKLVSFR